MLKVVCFDWVVGLCGWRGGSTLLPHSKTLVCALVQCEGSCGFPLGALVSSHSPKTCSFMSILRLQIPIGVIPVSLSAL